MATIPYTFACNATAAFLPDPEKHCMGYVTALTIGTTEHAKDLRVQLPALDPVTYLPFNYVGLDLLKSSILPPGLGIAVAVIQNVEWDGGVGSPLKLKFQISQANAEQLKALQQAALATTPITAIGWWIVDFDQETKQWYEKSFPIGCESITAEIGPKDSPELNVDLAPTQTSAGNVYGVTMSIFPAVNSQYSLHVANSAQTPVAKPWGLAAG